MRRWVERARRYAQKARTFARAWMLADLDPTEGGNIRVMILPWEPGKMSVLLHLVAPSADGHEVGAVINASEDRPWGEVLEDLGNAPRLIRDQQAMVAMRESLSAQVKGAG